MLLLKLFCCAVVWNGIFRSQAAQAAASAAAQINAKLGLANNIPPNPMGNMGNMSNMSNMGGMPGMGGGSGFTATEIIEVPDKMVGLGKL